MLLTMKDKKRIEVIMAVMDGNIKVEEAGVILYRSDRQIYRMLASVREEGIRGLIHKNGGRENPRRIEDCVRSKIVAFVQEKYQGI